MSERILNYSSESTPSRDGVCPLALVGAVATLICIALMVASIFVVPPNRHDRVVTWFELRTGTWMAFVTTCLASLGVAVSVIGMVIGRAKRASGMFLFINAICLLICFVWLIQ